MSSFKQTLNIINQMNKKDIVIKKWRKGRLLPPLSKEVINGENKIVNNDIKTPRPPTATHTPSETKFNYEQHAKNFPFSEVKCN